MKLGGFDAIKLRFILIFAMIVIVIAAAGGFVFVQKRLTDYATTITKLNADAQSGDQNIQTLRNLETRLKDEQSTIKAAQSVVADPASYSEQAINDITRIANNSGVAITSFEFVDSTGTTATAPPSGSAPSTPAVSGTATTTPLSGAVKKTVAVTIQSPLSYNSVMSFLRQIETNPLKMQVDSVSLTKDKGNNVSTGAFSIEVYVRQ